ncbi:hypothetical protein GCM10019059_39790 [Camelimonas fluminis]|nr:hypothetical protein GCM10019059_39790 [Camelimonas fluminis]
MRLGFTLAPALRKAADTSGGVTIEYAIIASVVVTAVTLTMTNAGPSLSGIFSLLAASILPASAGSG